MKTKSENSMNVENDLICALLCVEARISLLAKNKLRLCTNCCVCVGYYQILLFDLYCEYFLLLTNFQVF